MSHTAGVRRGFYLLWVSVGPSDPRDKIQILEFRKMRQLVKSYYVVFSRLILKNVVFRSAIAEIYDASVFEAARVTRGVVGVYLARIKRKAHTHKGFFKLGKRAPQYQLLGFWIFQRIQKRICQLPV